MAAVVIGVDPAKRSHTIEVIDGREQMLAGGRFDNTNAGYRAMRALARRWPKRVWAARRTRRGMNKRDRKPIRGRYSKLVSCACRRPNVIRMRTGRGGWARRGRREQRPSLRSQASMWPGSPERTRRVCPCGHRSPRQPPWGGWPG
jgi:hypothetical protein